MSKDLIVIFGPTASGKSKKAIDIALNHKATIINLDSMQVYKDLRILTDRPTEVDLGKCDHILYGYLNGNEKNTAASWLNDAVDEIKKCFLSKTLPILVGGTGMYLNALKNGLADIPDINEVTKNEVVNVDMSRYQFLNYSEIRKAEIEQDKRKKKRTNKKEEKIIINEKNNIRTTRNRKN